MGIFDKPRLRNAARKKDDMPEGLWTKCPECGAMIHSLELKQHHNVCPSCQHHFLLDSADRVELLADPGSFEETDANLISGNPLGFQKYEEKIAALREKTGLNDAVITGRLTIGNKPAMIAVMDFKFFAGSMGSVVGEKITRAIETAIAERRAVIIVSSSSGARMQEGMLSLMQMAKTCGALAKLSEAKLPYISVLTHPTTGGVTASFATIGDINLAEPKCMIGFAGPRVVKETTHQNLPPGFQTAEFMLEHGLIDAIVPRDKLRGKLAQILAYLMSDSTRDSRLMNYRDAIEWLFSTQTFGIKLGLENPTRLLREFLAFPAYGVKVVHVAGTNGKGSVCAIVDAVARATGRRTGLFTSPHLVDYRERMRVSGEMIPEETCAAYLTELRQIAETFENHPTFFEITLACAMRWFRERKCDLIALETGMGGRFDATNAVPTDVSVITPIGLDHTQWLGETLGKIAMEKAGIFRAGVPAVCAAQPEEARVVIEQSANQTRVKSLEFVTEPLRGYTLSLRGSHQRWNAALALNALHAAGVPLFHEAVLDGLSRTEWPARFECFPGEPPVILDGAHNPQAAASLAATWTEEFREKKATLIFGAVETKDVSGVLAHLAPLASRIFFVPVDSPRRLPVSALHEALEVVPDRPEVADFPSFKEAFAAAKNFPEPVLIAGSLFLAGQARALLTAGDFQRSAQ